MKSGEITNTTLRSMEFPPSFKMELNAIFEAMGGKWASGYKSGEKYQTWITGTQGVVLALTRFTGTENIATALPDSCVGLVFRNGSAPVAHLGKVLQISGSAGDCVLFVGHRV